MNTIPKTVAILAVICLVPYVALRCTPQEHAEPPATVKACVDDSVVQSPCLSGPAQRRCLSLRRLMEELRAEAGGKPLSADALVLGGITRADMVVTDPDGGDVILVGMYVPNAPPLHLDDLAVILWNVQGNGQYIHCSLDPSPTSIRRIEQYIKARAPLRDEQAMEEYRKGLARAAGPQCTRIGGVPKVSRLAHTMIDADYFMKRVSQGHIRVEGVTGAIDAPYSGGSGAAMARYWFHLADGMPVFVEDDGIIELADCRVVVLTERQRAAADGSLHDAGRPSESIQTFAREFSRQLPAIAQNEPSVARLISMYRLLAITKAMTYRGFTGDAGLDLSPLAEYQLRLPKPMPDALPGLANVRIRRHETARHIRYEGRIVCGGVSMEIALGAKSFAQAATPKLCRAQHDVMSARSAPGALWWAIGAATSLTRCGKTSDRPVAFTPAQRIVRTGVRANSSGVIDLACSGPFITGRRRQVAE